ncbi:MAG: DUF2207 domain-containing protein [archaeon]
MGNKKGFTSLRALVYFFIPAFIILILILWHATFGFFGVLSPIDRDYSLSGTTVNVEINSNGTVFLHEDINYYLKGCFYELYRTHGIARPLEYDIIKGNVPDEPYIEQISASCQPGCIVYDRQNEIAGNMGLTCDQNAQFLIDYSVNRGIVLGRDFAEFHYKIWGDDWKKKLDSLDGEITLPMSADDDVLVYFNPAGLIKYSVSENKIKFSSKNIRQYVEVRILMPKNKFSENSNFIKENDLKKQEIVNTQNSYYLAFVIVNILAIAAGIGIIFSLTYFPFSLYKKHGVEPDIAYNAMYEREPVSGIKPYVVNSLCANATGDTDKNALTATLLDLVRRKHIELKETPKKNRGIFERQDAKDVLLIFKVNNRDSLSAPEKLVYYYFRKFADDEQKLYWSIFLAKLKKTAAAKEFVKLQEDFEKSVDNDYDIKKYFNEKGNIEFKLFCGLIIALSVALFIVFGIINSARNFPILNYFHFIVLISVPLGIAGLFVPRNVFGRFTKEGYFIYKKSMNYKRFMTDLTLLKKYPPASIAIWEEQLVYATLFGVADKVLAAMKTTVKEEDMHSSGLYPLYRYSSLSYLNSSYSVASSTISSSSRGGSSGGFHGGGGVGGGFGGGGGGAR